MEKKQISHQGIISIIQASGGELANQLWNYISVYAYCKEHNYRLQNPSFYEYGHFFDLPKEGFFFNSLFFKPFSGNTKRKWSFKKRLWRKVYSLISRFIIRIHNTSSIFVEDSHTPFYLPPSLPSKDSLERYGKQYELLSKIEKNKPRTVYLSGWLYRNPDGIKKYHQDIVAYFKPKASTETKVKDYIKSLRTSYKHIIGIHIRQGDYATWQKGAYFLDQNRVAAVIREYITENHYNSNDCCFVIASDGPIKREAFQDLHIEITGMTMIEDLFILASTDAVIGSNSTFGDFAAYYGNIPHVIVEKETMDWEYYRNKKTFFPNKYCSWVHY